VRVVRVQSYYDVSMHCRLLSAGALNSLADVQREMRMLRGERERDEAQRQRTRFNPALAREIVLRNEPALHDANLAPHRRLVLDAVSFVQRLVPPPARVCMFRFRMPLSPLLKTGLTL
jgi:hypothetical protein